MANAFLNNTNQRTPLGSLSYDPTGTFSWSDPTTGQTYNIPRFTATQTLGPTQQQTQDQSEAAKLNLATLGNTQSQRLSTLLGQPFDLSQGGQPGDPTQISGIPRAQTTFGDPGWQQLHDFSYIEPPSTSYGGQGNYQSQIGSTPGAVFGFGGEGDITRTYGPQDNFSADRSRVEQSLFDRLNPQLDRQQEQLRQQLADQGIRYGSEAYTAAMDNFGRQANDARLAITAQGGQEQQRLADMAAKQAGFQNAAQQQAYQEAQGRGAFYNTAAQQAFAEAQGRGTFANQAQTARAAEAVQRGTFYNSALQQAYEQAQGRGAFANTAQAAAFQQAAARGGFANTALQQQVGQAQAAFNAQNAARAQYLQEQYALRNQPINETSALLSGSQVQQPQFMQTPQQQIPTTDYAALINQNFQQQFQNYQAQNQNANQLLGGVLGLAGNVVRSPLLSDRRAKRQIHRIGTVFAAEPQPVQEPDAKRLPIYEYSYKDDPASTRHVGPMAQDVERIDPGAVGTVRSGRHRGMKTIDQSRVMGSILRAA